MEIFPLARVLPERSSSKSKGLANYIDRVCESTIHKWREQLAKYKDKAFAGAGHAYTEEARINELERMVGRLALENDFLKKLLQKLENDS